MLNAQFAAYLKARNGKRAEIKPYDFMPWADKPKKTQKQLDADIRAGLRAAARRNG